MKLIAKAVTVLTFECVCIEWIQTKLRKQAAVSIIQLFILSYLFYRGVLSCLSSCLVGLGGKAIIPPFYDGKGGSVIIYFYYRSIEVFL
jgi:hypothetical protein